jgi:hypothetical protein
MTRTTIVLLFALGACSQSKGQDLAACRTDAIKASASDSERNNYTYLCTKAKGYVLAKDLTKDCTVYELVGSVESEIKEDCYRKPWPWE